MSNITLELREQDSERNYGNGDWETNIEPQTIYEGDEIVMRNVFIDTEATSNEKINIPEDLKINLEYIYYFNNYLAVNGSPNFFKDAVNSNPQPPDGRTYIQYVPSYVPSGTGAVKAFTQLQFEFTGGTPVGFKCPATDFTLFYKDADGNEQSIRLHLNEYTNKSSILPTNQVVRLPHAIFITTDGTSTQGLTFSPNRSEFSGIPYRQAIGFFGSGLLEDQIVLQPQKGKSSFTLAQGSYSPVDLCNFINTELSTVNLPSGATNLYTGNDLLVKGTMKGLVGGGYGVAIGIGDGLFSEGGPVLLGASKVEISYLDAQQRFAWDMFHTPMYDETGTESVRIEQDAGDSAIQRQISGLCWTHLGAERVSNGATFDFWEALLGFNLESLYPTNGNIQVYPTTKSPFFGVGPPAPDMAVVQPLIDINVTDPDLPTMIGTGGYCGLDSLVPKGKTFSQDTTGKNFFLPVENSSGPYFVPTNGVNERIIAGNSVLGTTSQFGYFVIEVQGKFRNDVIGSGINKNNVVGIVGRFYELNSYTQGTEGDSIIYKHTGSPIIVDSFKCRILDSTKNLADNIGNDNTIFLTINRGQKALMADIPEFIQKQINK